jgi:hypothetical protein
VRPRLGDVLNVQKTGFPEGEIGRRFWPRTHKAENVPGAPTYDRRERGSRFNGGQHLFFPALLTERCVAPPERSFGSRAEPLDFYFLCGSAPRVKDGRGHSAKGLIEKRACQFRDPVENARVRRGGLDVFGP